MTRSRRKGPRRFLDLTVGNWAGLAFGMWTIVVAFPAVARGALKARRRALSRGDFNRAQRLTRVMRFFAPPYDADVVKALEKLEKTA